MQMLESEYCRIQAAAIKAESEGFEETATALRDAAFVLLQDVIFCAGSKEERDPRTRTLQP